MKIKLLLLCLFMPFLMYGQGVVNFLPKENANNVKSPTSTSLCSFVNFPSSSYTGAVDINVPLWIMKGKNIQVPISLNYNSSGVMPENKPGWVGQNWSLSCGGVITRTIRGGLNDEFNGSNNIKGYYYCGSQFINDNSYFVRQDKANYSDIPYDPEADMFNFTILGKSGTFFLNQKGEWVVQSDYNFTVEKISDIESIKNPSSYFGFSFYTEIYPSFFKFILKDDEGNQYIFGSSFDAIEYSCDMQEKTGKSIVSNAWYLTKIITHNSNDIINFNYERGPFLCNISKISSYTKVTDYNSMFSDWLYTGVFISPVYLTLIYINSGEYIKFFANKSYQLDYPFSLIREASMIEGSSYAEQYAFLKAANLTIPNFQKYGQTLASNYALFKIRPLRLDSLKIYNSQGRNMQNILFNYNCTPADTTKRLFLDKIVVSSQNNKGEEHSFIYDNKELLPNYLSSVTDHWGFNNNKIYPNIFHIFNGRDSDSTKVKFGSLIQINYPTGGNVKFEYSIHTASKYINRNHLKPYDTLINSYFALIDRSVIVGGLRIKKVTISPKPGLTYEKRYIYQRAISDQLQFNGYELLLNLENQIFNSSGILNGFPVYHCVAKAKNANGIDITFENIYSSPQMPLTNSNCGNIGYSEVGELNFVNGKFLNAKVLKFSDHISNYEFLSTQNNVIVVADNYFERGKILNEVYLDSLRNITKEINYNYSNRNVSDSTKNNRSAKYSYIGNISQNTTTNIMRICYYNYTHKYLLSSKITKEYTKNGVLETTEKYDYDKYNVLKYLKTYNSNKDTILAVYKHPQDFLSNISQTTEMLSLKSLVDNKCFSFPVEQIGMSIHNNDTTIVNGKLFTYTINGININRHRYYELNNSIPQSTLVKTALYPNKNLYKLLETYSYDLTNSLKQIKYRGNKSDLYYWNNKGMNPFLIIKNIDTTKINLINKYSDFYNLYNSVLKNYEVDYYHNKLINDAEFKDCQIESYYFEPSIGLAQSADSKGVKRYYQYDNFGRLICVRDNNRNVLERYAYHYQNGNTPESLQIPENNIGAKLTCTLSGNGTLGNNNSLLRVGDAINLGVIFPVTPNQYYELDGYYVNGVLIPNPGNYIVQGDVQIEARTKEMLSPEVMISYLAAFGSSGQFNFKYKFNGQTWTSPSTISSEEACKTIDVRVSNFPIQLSFTASTSFPSLRITHNGVIIYENLWPVAAGFVFEFELTKIGPHDILIEIP